MKRWEEKPDYRIFYLRDCQVLQKENNTNSDRQSVNKQFKEQVKSKGAARAGASNLYRTGSKRNSNNQTWKSNTDSGGTSYFKEARNPGNFDQKFYYENRDFTQVYGKNCRITDQETWKFREWLAKLRRNWKRLLVSQMGARHGNSMSAILLGEKSELDAR